LSRLAGQVPFEPGKRDKKLLYNFSEEKLTLDPVTDKSLKDI
jgi:hypothetical protein